MSDLDLTKKTNFNQNQNTGSSQNLKDQVADAGAEVKQRADDALRATSDVARDKFKEAADAAKDVASETVDQFQGEAREQQRSGADFIERFAGNVREAARAFESEAPFAARGINSAAEYVEDAAEKIRNGSFRDLVDGATDFAKRQPAAFLGISVLAGFAAFRFLKASGGQTSSSQRRNTERGDALGGSSSAPRGEAWRQGSSRPGNSWEQTSSSQRGNMS
jgi:gas vesicle protein